MGKNFLALLILKFLQHSKYTYKYNKSSKCGLAQTYWCEYESNIIFIAKIFMSSINFDKYKYMQFNINGPA